MKNFDDFIKQLDFNSIRDYSVKKANEKDKNDNQHMWYIYQNQYTTLEILRRYHEWLIHDDRSKV